MEPPSKRLRSTTGGSQGWTASRDQQQPSYPYPPHSHPPPPAQHPSYPPAPPHQHHFPPPPPPPSTAPVPGQQDSQLPWEKGTTEEFLPWQSSSNGLPHAPPPPAPPPEEIPRPPPEEAPPPPKEAEEEISYSYSSSSSSSSSTSSSSSSSSFPQYEFLDEEESSVIPKSKHANSGLIEKTPSILHAGNRPNRFKTDKGKEEQVKGQKQAMKKPKPKAGIRKAADKVWYDPSLEEWPENDFRIFVGDLGNEVTDDNLRRAFSKYPSLAKVRVLRDLHSGRTRGFGFVSFVDPMDFAKAMKEMNGKYIGNRPCKLKRSTWKTREIDAVVEKEKEKRKAKELLRRQK